jgi:hypothetical protein
MAWTYHQSTGDLFHNGVFVGTGYSGAGKTLQEGRNNGAMESVVKKGPIPRGRWKIGNPRNGTKMGPIAIALTPNPAGVALGRSGFFIHGDNKASNASEGCIILARGIRLEIVGSSDKILEVV